MVSLNGICESFTSTLICHFALFMCCIYIEWGGQRPLQGSSTYQSSCNITCACIGDLEHCFRCCVVLVKNYCWIMKWIKYFRSLCCMEWYVQALGWKNCPQFLVNPRLRLGLMFTFRTIFSALGPYRCLQHTTEVLYSQNISLLPLLKKLFNFFLTWQPLCD